LKALNNFNGVMEILAGLRNSSVHRLKKTWGSLPKDRMKSFEEMMDLMSPDANFTKLRKELRHNIAPPCIPYLGMYLTDLTFIEEGNPDLIGELFNFDKRRRIATVIKEIQQYQNEPYCLKEVPIIRGFVLAGGEYVDENKCYQLSLQIEPRDGKAKQVSKPWRKSTTGEIKKALEKRSKNQVIVIGKDQKRDENPKVPVKQLTEEPTSPHKLTVEDLVDTLMDGNNLEVEQYLDSLDATNQEKMLMREEILKVFDERMEKKERVNFFETPEQENEEIPFETLVGFLEQGDTLHFDAFFEGLEIYEAERIREQAIKMYEQRCV